MSVSNKTSVFENATPDEPPFPKLKPVGKKSVAGSEPGDSKPKEADSKRSSIALKAGLFGESKSSKPPVQLKKAESPATTLLPGGKAEPLSPLTPAPVKRIIPELKGAREEADVLPPEERLKIHRESIANMTEAPQRIVPQLKGENDNPDILPPEERRRIASMRMQESSGERVIPKLVSDNDDLSILPPEERRRIAREQAQKQQENRSRGGSMVSQASKQSSIKGIPSVSSKHSKPTPVPTPTQVPVRSPATMSIKSPLQVEPKSPLFPSGECENCANRQQQIDDLEGKTYNLEREVQTKDEKIKVLEKKVTSEKDAAAKEKKKAKDELAKKDKKIRALEHDLRESQRQAARRGSSSSAGGGQMAELLAQRDATIAQLQKQIEDQQHIIEAADNDEDFSQAQSDAGSVEDEVATLNSQIWALETACEFRMREINRLNQTMQDFVAQVDKLDKELAEAMRQILEGGRATQKEEEKAVFGGPIEDVVNDFKQKRSEVKAKKRRRPRKGALSRENAELRDELATLREEMVVMRSAMASKNPQLFIQAMHKTGGPSAQALYGAPAAGASQKNCCFTAAFIAAGQAEAQIETLKGHYKKEQDRCSQLESMLNKARNAIVSSAGVGYENEIKLQQAKRALQCIIDAPEEPQKSTAPTAVPHSSASAGFAIANMPSTAQIAQMASTHSSVFERREKSNCIHVRSISPTRNAAWVTAPPVRPVWETRIG
eukprot:TRINITY_DN1874_c0_g3_i1.p1 TRINITY_DN1874_c0_g3~~TRINITY_DN1874_c0_g3_i1.p1  ORF type:complete len:721 (+),score=209.31 TRINITY_DN1874_c0_g3_i1:103-2265(+)